MCGFRVYKGLWFRAPASPLQALRCKVHSKREPKHTRHLCPEECEVEVGASVVQLHRLEQSLRVHVPQCQNIYIYLYIYIYIYLFVYIYILIYIYICYIICIGLIKQSLYRHFGAKVYTILGTWSLREQTAAHHKSDFYQQLNYARAPVQELCGCTQTYCVGLRPRVCVQARLGLERWGLMGVSENRGTQYSTLNSRILTLRTPK